MKKKSGEFEDKENRRSVDRRTAARRRDDKRLLWAACIMWTEKLEQHIAVIKQDFISIDDLHLTSIDPDIVEVIHQKQLYSKMSKDARWVIDHVIMERSPEVTSDLQNIYSKGNQALNCDNPEKLLERGRLIKFLKKKFGSQSKALKIFREIKYYVQHF